MKTQLHTLLLLIVSVVGIVVLNVGFVFLLLGFLPTVIAYIVDETQQKDLYKTVRAANLAGILPTLFLLTNRQYAGAIMQIKMSDPNTWFFVYGCAAAGWILIFVCKFFSYLSILASGETRIHMLERSREELIEEWGETIKEYTITTR